MVVVQVAPSAAASRAHKAFQANRSRLHFENQGIPTRTSIASIGQCRSFGAARAVAAARRRRLVPHALGRTA